MAFLKWTTYTLADAIAGQAQLGVAGVRMKGRVCVEGPDGEILIQWWARRIWMRFPSAGAPDPEWPAPKTPAAWYTRSVSTFDGLVEVRADIRPIPLLESGREIPWPD